MSTLQIETTQNVRLEYQPASVGDRILAYLIDSLLLGAWMIGVMILIGTLFDDGNVRGDVRLASILVLIGIPFLFYHLLNEIFFNGQSIGKRALGIRVVLLDGNPPTLGAYLLRWVFRLVDVALTNGILAVVMVAAGGKGQRLGDLAAGTTVVKVQAPMVLDQILTERQQQPDYQPTFSAAALLSDRDANTIRAALDKGLTEGNPDLIAAAAQRVKAVTGVTSTLSDDVFLRIILRDHTFLATRD
jgi:uncharacterized RDD family membrane protein YckC